MSRPTARPSRVSPRPGKRGAAADSRPDLTANGAQHTPAAYLTRSWLLWLQAQISDRDWQVLRFIHESRFVTGPQLVRMIWQASDREASPARAGRRALRRLIDWRVLEALPRQVGGRRTGSDQLIYTLGRAGTRLLEANGTRCGRPELPGLLHLTHTLATTELVVQLHEAHRAGEIELIEAQQEPVCWRSYTGPALSRRTLKPDLFLRIGAGDQEDRWMIEVDQATESRRALTRKLAQHLEYYRAGTEHQASGTHPRILWTTPDTTRAEQLQALIDHQPKDAKRLLTVCRFKDTVALLAREARS